MAFDRKKCVTCCSILGAHFMMAPLSFLWFYGNLIAYMDSYFHFSRYHRYADVDTQWILALCMVGFCAGFFLSRPLVKNLGMKRSLLLAMLSINTSFLGCAWMLQHSVLGTALLIGIFMAPGVSTVACIIVQFVHAWAPKNVAVLTATTSSFPMVLSMAQNQIITEYVNPENLKANAQVGPKTFFSQPEILERVPTCVVIIAVIILGLQAVGFLLMSNPPSHSAVRDHVTTGVETCSKEINAHNTPSYGSHRSEKQTVVNVQSDTQMFNDSHDKGKCATISGDNTLVASNAKDSPRSLRPLDALQTIQLYTLLLYGIAIVFGLLLKVNYYKQFGLLYINNDSYLTLVGTLLPISASVGRIGCGACIDRGILSIKASVIVSSAVNSLLCAFWFFTPQVDAILYMVQILLMSCVQSTFFVITPIATLRFFGPDHFPALYGILNSPFPIVGLLSAVLVTPVLNVFGWFWLFAFCSFLSGFAMVLVIVTRFDI